MTKPALFPFEKAHTADEIVAAIDAKITTTQNLHAFRTRVGGAKKADRLYPATREALNIIKKLRQESRDRKAFKDLLRPFSQKFAEGATLTQILSPVLEGYRQMFLDKLGLDLRPEQIIMMIVATDGVEKLQKAGYPLIGDFPTSCN